MSAGSPIDLSKLKAEIQKTKDLVDDLSASNLDASDLTKLRFHLASLIEEAAKLIAKQSHIGSEGEDS